MSKQALFTLITSCIALTLVISISPAFSQEPGLADSPWPMYYQDPQLSQVTSFMGPYDDEDTSEAWRRDYGYCATLGAVDSEGFLYITFPDLGAENKNNFLRKLNPDTGVQDPNSESPVDLGVSQYLTGVPLVMQELDQSIPVDRIYTQQGPEPGQPGKLRKWDPSLNEIIATGKWPVEIKQGITNLTPWSFVPSTNNRTLISAASTEAGTKAVLFGIDKYDGESDMETFDVHDWFMQHKCVASCPGGMPIDEVACNPTNTNCCHGSNCVDFTGSLVTIQNTAPIARDTASPDNELVFVLIKEGYLIAVIFDKFGRTFGLPGMTDPVKWHFKYSPEGSGSSPSVVEHPSDSNKDRVYFVSGKKLSQWATLYSIFTGSTGKAEPMAQTYFDIENIPDSPVVEYNPAKGGNTISIQNSLGIRMVFLDTLSPMPFNSLSCKWRTEQSVHGIPANLIGAGKSAGGLLYQPFLKFPTWATGGILDIIGNNSSLTARDSEVV